jgi:hypothetical protein
MKTKLREVFLGPVTDLPVLRDVLRLPILASLLVLALAVALEVPALRDPEALALLGGLAALGFVDIRLPAFYPAAAASTTAILEVPKYKLTLTRLTLRLGGTTFTKALISEIRILRGTRVVYRVSGTRLDKINKYKGIFDRDQFLVIDFTERDAPSLPGKELGGYDLTTFGKDEDLRVEVDIGAATAPTLYAIGTFTPPQGNPLMLKLLTGIFSTSGTGEQPIKVNLKGALLKRLHLFYAGTDWSNTATAAAWTTNTGNGAMGAITVSAAAKVGVYKLRVIEPAANAGTFIIEDPDGNEISVKGTVGSAYSGGGLAFTLADGATDFVSGDGFDITVSAITDGNVNKLVVKKDGAIIWDRTCTDNRFVQQEYRKVPQSQCYVYDPVVDNNMSGMLKTADAASLEFNPFLTAGDTITYVAEVIDAPDNLAAL